jgi:glycosyltransferase involved in cell wall biosynthesis
MAPIYINGKFTAQRTTGVQRFARQVVLALDAQLDGPLRARIGPVHLLCPPGGEPPHLAQVQTTVCGPAALPLHLWEQVVLPWHARQGLLVNLAGSAPWFSARQWCTFHDAAVFDHPGVHTRLFGAWYRRLFRHQARNAERLLTVSLHSRARLAVHLGIDAASLAVVPNGGEHLVDTPADPQIVADLGLTGQRWLLAVGSLNPVKNLSMLLQVWQGLVDTNGVRLVIVGGADPRVFAAQAAAGGASDTGAAAPVVRAGRVDDAALKALYLGAQGLVFPSLDEGFGLPPLEAMALGCPVVAARAGAVPEVCGDAALYFDPRDPQDMAAALRRLLDDAPLRATLAEAGRQRAASWTWSLAAHRLAALLSRAEGSAEGGGSF